MYFTKDTNLFGKRLNIFRKCLSKPQWTNFKTYIHGLLLGEKGEKNIEDIASNILDGKHQSSLNRFLTKRKWSAKKVNALRLKEHLHNRIGGVMALDDVLIEKSGKLMEGVGYLKDHCSGNTVLSHNMVSTFYRNGKQRVPLYSQLYFKDNVADQLDMWFKTKIQIAVDLLRLSLSQVNPEVIVFDSWYMAKDILEFISSRGLTWVSKAKNNRLIFIDEKWVSLKWYAKHLSKKSFSRIDKVVDEKRYKWFFEATVTMKNVGEIKLVVLRTRKNSKSFSFLTSNNTKLNGLHVLGYYKKRWSIEVFHRDCKQHLGIGEYQARKLDAVVIHLHLVFLAYTLLKNAWCNPSLQKVLNGIKAIGSACNTLKRWIFDQFSKKLKTPLTIEIG
jgi:hypothetical protein